MTGKNSLRGREIFFLFFIILLVSAGAYLIRTALFPSLPIQDKRGKTGEESWKMIKSVVS